MRAGSRQQQGHVLKTWHGAGACRKNSGAELIWIDVRSAIPQNSSNKTQSHDRAVMRSTWGSLHWKSPTQLLCQIYDKYLRDRGPLQKR